MKKLKFRYEMELKLDRPVRDHHFRIRCKPMEAEGQHCESFLCRTWPETTLSLVEDGFGNHGFAGVIRQPHDSLTVTAEGIVCVKAVLDTQLHPMYRFVSARTVPSAQISGFLREVEQELGRPVSDQEGLLVLMDRLHGRFLYVPGVTSVRTTAAEAFAGGCGVCQDYAHIFISLCRLGGIPARYVAGLVPGEGATHAWAEVWDQGAWRGYDPTHNALVDETYIKLTHGRDFVDGTVDKGCFLGYAYQMQQIYAKVEELE
ncbi:MAG: transglutaminase family protein [Lachnospiraceae bacterium]|nr:transglutaminase family protein [Lachnospiraceae bacterium]